MCVRGRFTRELTSRRIYLAPRAGKDATADACASEPQLEAMKASEHIVARPNDARTRRELREPALRTLGTCNVCIGEGLR